MNDRGNDMKNKLNITGIDAGYIALAVIVTMIGAYFLYQLLEAFGWDTLAKDWPMYSLMYAIAMLSVGLFWALSNLVSACEDETADIFSEMSKD
jgi:hypothetical protein